MTLKRYILSQVYIGATLKPSKQAVVWENASDYMGLREPGGHSLRVSNTVAEVETYSREQAIAIFERQMQARDIRKLEIMDLNSKSKGNEKAKGFAKLPKSEIALRCK